MLFLIITECIKKVVINKLEDAKQNVKLIYSLQQFLKFLKLIDLFYTIYKNKKPKKIISKSFNQY